MKTLRDYAKDHGVEYQTAWNRWKAGKIPSAYKDEFGRILIPENEVETKWGECIAGVHRGAN